MGSAMAGVVQKIAKRIAVNALTRKIYKKTDPFKMFVITTIILFSVFFVIVLALLTNPISRIILSSGIVLKIVSGALWLVSGFLSLIGQDTSKIDSVREFLASPQVKMIRELQEKYKIDGIDYDEIDDFLDDWTDLNDNDEEEDSDSDDDEEEAHSTGTINTITGESSFY